MADDKELEGKPLPNPDDEKEWDPEVVDKDDLDSKEQK